MRILIIFNGGLGDICLFRHVLTSLRNTYPFCQVTFSSTNSNKNLLSHTHIIESFDIYPQIIYDLIICYGNQNDLVNIPSHKNLIMWNFLPPCRWKGHIVHWWIKAFKGKYLINSAHLYNNFNLKSGLITLTPGTSIKQKLPNITKYLATIKSHLTNNITKKGIIITDCQYHNYGYASYINSEFDNFHHCYNLTLYQIMTQFSKSHVVIGSDSGLTHLAVWSDVPIVERVMPDKPQFPQQWWDIIVPGS